MSFVLTEPLKPGEPGGPWTEEEIDIVRDKVISYLTTVSNEDLGSWNELSVWEHLNVYIKFL